MATAPDGSAVLPAAGDGSPPAGGGGMDVNVAMRMVAAAEAAAEAARAATNLASRSTSEDQGKSWWKLLPRPPVFDHSSRESEIAGWKEGSWMFEQYVASVDTRFSDDVQQIRSNLNTMVDPVDFSDSEKQRNSFFYSLLSSLLRQRPLLVVRQVSGSNGFEAYRLLIQQNEPLSKNRSMGLLNVIMNWPTFSGKMSYMQQILKLEHAYAEYEKLGTRLNDDLKTAVLMRSITGQLKTWLQLQVSETTTYAKVREMIMAYDASTTRWSEQMVLGIDNSSPGTDGPVPMEIDRIEGKGKGKHHGKGKSKDKGSSKGKAGGKQKGKDGKGKSQKGDQKGSKGGGAGKQSKGKGKGEKQCYVCGHTGHYARDCWQQVRNVSTDGGQGSTVQGSPASSAGGMSSVSHSQPVSQPSNSAQATQHRVARILETGDDVKHDELVFDLRSSGSSHFSGNVNALHYFIGDDDDFQSMGHVRAVIDEMSDSGEEMFNILLDSGADASIFPVTLLGKGRPTEGVVGKLHDAQGAEIPIDAVQDMEIRLKDVSGSTVILRERVAVSKHVSQPILSFGRLLEGGWSIDGCQQALTHHAGANIPVELQNKSLMVQGTIRVLRESCDVVDMHVRAIQADVMEHVVEGCVGWDLDAYGQGLGRHFDNKYQDPSLVKPDLPGRFCRTTLIEGDDKKWYVVELCERLDGFDSV